MAEREGVGYIVAAVGDESGDVPYTAYMVLKSKVEENAGLYERYLRAGVPRPAVGGHAHAPPRSLRSFAPQFPDSDVELLTRVAENYQRIGA